MIQAAAPVPASDADEKKHEVEYQSIIKDLQNRLGPLRADILSTFPARTARQDGEIMEMEIKAKERGLSDSDLSKIRAESAKEHILNKLIRSSMLLDYEFQNALDVVRRDMPDREADLNAFIEDILLKLFGSLSPEAQIFINRGSYRTLLGKKLLERTSGGAAAVASGVAHGRR